MKSFQKLFKLRVRKCTDPNLKRGRARLLSLIKVLKSGPILIPSNIPLQQWSKQSGKVKKGWEISSKAPKRVIVE